MEPYKFLLQAARKGIIFKQLFGTKAMLEEDIMLDHQCSYFNKITWQQVNLGLHFFLFDHKPKLSGEMETSDSSCI